MELLKQRDAAGMVGIVHKQIEQLRLIIQDWINENEVTCNNIQEIEKIGGW